MEKKQKRISKLIETIKKDTPLWFRKLKKATSLTSDTAVVVLLALGYTESSFLMLVSRVGLSYALNLIEIFTEPKE